MKLLSTVDPWILCRSLFSANNSELQGRCSSVLPLIVGTSTFLKKLFFLYYKFWIIKFYHWSKVHCIQIKITNLLLVQWAPTKTAMAPAESTTPKKTRTASFFKLKKKNWGFKFQPRQIKSKKGSDGCNAKSSATCVSEMVFRRWIYINDLL